MTNLGRENEGEDQRLSLTTSHHKSNKEEREQHWGIVERIDEVEKF